MFDNAQKSPTRRDDSNESSTVNTPDHIRETTEPVPGSDAGRRRGARSSSPDAVKHRGGHTTLGGGDGVTGSIGKEGTEPRACRELRHAGDDKSHKPSSAHHQVKSTTSGEPDHRFDGGERHPLPHRSRSPSPNAVCAATDVGVRVHRHAHGESQRAQDEENTPSSSSSHRLNSQAGKHRRDDNDGTFSHSHDRGREHGSRERENDRSKSRVSSSHGQRHPSTRCHHRDEGNNEAGHDVGPHAAHSLSIATTRSRDTDDRSTASKVSGRGGVHTPSPTNRGHHYDERSCYQRPERERSKDVEPGHRYRSSSSTRDANGLPLTQLHRDHSKEIGRACDRVRSPAFDRVDDGVTSASTRSHHQHQSSPRIRRSDDVSSDQSPAHSEDEQSSRHPRWSTPLNDDRKHRSTDNRSSLTRNVLEDDNRHGSSCQRRVGLSSPSPSSVKTHGRDHHRSADDVGGDDTLATYITPEKDQLSGTPRARSASPSRHRHQDHRHSPGRVSATAADGGAKEGDIGSVLSWSSSRSSPRQQGDRHVLRDRSRSPRTDESDGHVARENSSSKGHSDFSRHRDRSSRSTPGAHIGSRHAPGDKDGHVRDDGRGKCVASPLADHRNRTSGHKCRENSNPDANANEEGSLHSHFSGRRSGEQLGESTHGRRGHSHDATGERDSRVAIHDDNRNHRHRADHVGGGEQDDARAFSSTHQYREPSTTGNFRKEASDSTTYGMFRAGHDHHHDGGESMRCRTHDHNHLESARMRDGDAISSTRHEKDSDPCKRDASSRRERSSRSSDSKSRGDHSPRDVIESFTRYETREERNLADDDKFSRSRVSRHCTTPLGEHGDGGTGRRSGNGDDDTARSHRQIFSGGPDRLSPASCLRLPSETSSHPDKHARETSRTASPDGSAPIVYARPSLTSRREACNKTNQATTRHDERKLGPDWARTEARVEAGWRGRDERREPDDGADGGSSSPGISNRVRQHERRGEDESRRHRHHRHHQESDGGSDGRHQHRHGEKQEKVVERGGTRCTHSGRNAYGPSVGDRFCGTHPRRHWYRYSSRLQYDSL